MTIAPDELTLDSAAAVAVPPMSCGESTKRVLCLSTAIIDHAPRVRPNPSGIMVGGHQGSAGLKRVDGVHYGLYCASLWLTHLQAEDRV